MKIETISATIGVIITLGGILYSAVSLKKDVEIISQKNDLLENKINTNTESAKNLALDVQKIQSAIENNENNLSRINEQIKETNKLLLESVNETRSILLKEISNEKYK